MEEEKKKSKKGVIILALLLIVCVSIGYAALTAQLNIDGATKIKGNNWDIDIPNDNFNTNADPTEYPDCNATTAVGCPLKDDQQDKGGDTEVTQVPIKVATPEGEVKVEWAVVLHKPGDYYEFTVDAENDGTVDAKLSEVTINGITTAQQAYATYSVTYDDDSAIAVGDTLGAGTTRTVKVRVAYRSDISSDVMPSSDVDLGDSSKKLTVSMKYVQD